MKRMINCASIVAIVAGSLAAAAPAYASNSDLSLSPLSVAASHETLKAAALNGDSVFEIAQSQQQQQQQNNTTTGGKPKRSETQPTSANGFVV